MDAHSQTLFTTHRVPLHKNASSLKYSSPQVAVGVSNSKQTRNVGQISFAQPSDNNARYAPPMMFVEAAPTKQAPQYSGLISAPSRNVAPKMVVGKQSQASWGSSKMNFNDMASKAKMRVNRSQVSMSAVSNDSNEFQVSTSAGSNMNMNANHMDEQMNTKMIGQLVGATAVALALFSANPAFAADLGNGKQIFEGNCAACHSGGQNVIEAQKTLDKDALAEYLDGGFNEKAIITQVKNGKNSMPAWSGRLSEDEILNVSAYVYDQASGSKWGA